MGAADSAVAAVTSSPPGTTSTISASAATDIPFKSSAAASNRLPAATATDMALSPPDSSGFSLPKSFSPTRALSRLWSSNLPDTPLANSLPPFSTCTSFPPYSPSGSANVGFAAAAALSNCPSFSRNSSWLPGGEGLQGTLDDEGVFSLE
eukprot:CAMPEP_0202902994 /NCGR_PEP_ID=MMETSP1392-20130828/20277_1 /ASSEMBLY_ACC=CAM_ASM_000868 /TAXON_ID=225041 /ORGANISM="Chlamydomonas chlamydogama, Strain SAG 11-48b" /LENGTH=149 /DNA_ID=CAMNT_0049589935 /DNA_START=197 /DNA_END=646 /DNA_ORIENTATION=-